MSEAKLKKQAAKLKWRQDWHEKDLQLMKAHNRIVPEGSYTKPGSMNPKK